VAKYNTLRKQTAHATSTDQLQIYFIAIVQTAEATLDRLQPFVPLQCRRTFYRKQVRSTRKLVG